MHFQTLSCRSSHIENAGNASGVFLIGNFQSKLECSSFCFYFDRKRKDLELAWLAWKTFDTWNGDSQPVLNAQSFELREIDSGNGPFTWDEWMLTSFRQGLNLGKRNRNRFLLRDGTRSRDRLIRAEAFDRSPADSPHPELGAAVWLQGRVDLVLILPTMFSSWLDQKGLGHFVTTCKSPFKSSFSFGSILRLLKLAIKGKGDKTVSLKMFFVCLKPTQHPNS